MCLQFFLLRFAVWNKLLGANFAIGRRCWSCVFGDVLPRFCSMSWHFAPENARKISLNVRSSVFEFVLSSVFRRRRFCLFFGENQKGTAGRGREKCHDNLRQTSRQFATCHDNLRHFMTTSVSLFH